MEKTLRNILIFITIIVGIMAYYLSSQMKFHRPEQDIEENEIEQAKAPIRKKEKIEKPESEKINDVPKYEENNAKTEESIPPSEVPKYEDSPVETNIEVETETIENKKAAFCEARMADCLYVGVLFNYPSLEFPWSEENDNQIVECVASVANCKNQNYQLLTKEEEINFVKKVNEIKRMNIKQKSNPQN